MGMNIGSSGSAEPEVMIEMNATPLIDVMLVMLIMILITLPPQRHAVKLDTPIPCATCEVEEAPPKPVLIQVDFDGAIHWNGVAMSAAELDRRFAEEAKRAQQAEVHIQPHRLAKYGVVAHVMAAAQRQGMKKIGVVGSVSA